MIQKDNVIMLTTREHAEKIFVEKVGIPSNELTLVVSWMPVPDGAYQTEIWLTGDKLESDTIHFAPKIKDVAVDWCFDRNYIEDAYRILDIFNKAPVFLSAKIASPLWVEAYNDPEKEKKEDDIVILIAPRIPNTEEVS